jgi:hypothetical protein
MIISNKLNSYLMINFIFLGLFIGCAKDKNMDDYRREQLQISLSKISAISGAYSGVMSSKVDGSNLGNIILKFKATTDVQSGSGSTSTNQTAIVSGSIKLQSLTSAEVSFDNGYYESESGNFQVSIPVVQDNVLISKISLSGQIINGHWIGSIEVKGQPQNGADLNLVKNATPGNTSSIEVGGIRLEQIRKMDYPFLGFYNFNSITSPFKMNISNREATPEQTVFKLLSPIRQVNLSCDLSDFELIFNNAILDDTMGTIVAHDPTDQGRPVRADLFCKMFELGADFGWDCEVQTKTGIFRTHLKAKL